MTRYPTQSWSDVVAFYRWLATENAYFAPLRDAVELLAASSYAAALHPRTSMQTLLLYQHQRAGPEDEELRLDFEQGTFVVRYRSGAAPDPRFRLRETPGVWTKRGPDALALLARAFHHLRWFAEYHTPAASTPPRDPAV